MPDDTFRVSVNPTGPMNLLSKLEVDHLQESSTSDLYRLFRNCSLAVLNCGSETDNVDDIFEQHKNFKINVLQRERGIKLELINPPKRAFVDGKLITGISEHLFAVLRDILFVEIQHQLSQRRPLSAAETTHQVFDILRNAQVIRPQLEPNLVVCWGGHSIGEEEYDYTKRIGYELGLREFSICTGCGPGAMKGPMKGATIGHAKQRFKHGRYLGISEPSIIAAEPPNPIVTQLVIMPDIEKRLEAFTRSAHAIVIFPGGAGTAEELLYLLGIMLHPKNHDQQLPIVLTGPKASSDYFAELDAFIHNTLGGRAQNLYKIVIDDAQQVATYLRERANEVKEYRRQTGDAYHFNWSLHIDEDFQRPFIPNHDNMQALNLHPKEDKALLAAHLRRAFSGIVAGNIKPEWIAAIASQGPYQLHGNQELMTRLDRLLKHFVEQQRMKLPGSQYVPCYQVIV
mgnify:CR=1 FL=1